MLRIHQVDHPVSTTLLVPAYYRLPFEVVQLSSTQPRASVTPPTARAKSKLLPSVLRLSTSFVSLELYKGGSAFESQIHLSGVPRSVQPEQGAVPVGVKCLVSFLRLRSDTRRRKSGKMKKRTDCYIEDGELDMDYLRVGEES